MSNYSSLANAHTSAMMRPISHRDPSHKWRCVRTEGHEQKLAFSFEGRDTAIQDVDPSNVHGIGQRMPQIRTMTGVARSPKGYTRRSIRPKHSITSDDGFQNSGYNGLAVTTLPILMNGRGDGIALPIGLQASGLGKGVQHHHHR